MSCFWHQNILHKQVVIKPPFSEYACVATSRGPSERFRGPLGGSKYPSVSYKLIYNLESQHGYAYERIKYVFIWALNRQ